MAVAITYNGQRHYFNYGVASKDTKKPVTDQTLFEIGSISKTFTATLGAYAQAQGKLSLADPASRFAPELRGSAFEGISLLNLATYTAGGLPLQFPAEADHPDRMFSYYTTWKPLYPAGTQRLYSNPSIGLFGYLAARSLERPFDEVMERTLMPGLGLQHSYVRVPQDQLGRYAQGYAKDGKPRPGRTGSPGLRGLRGENQLIGPDAFPRGQPATGKTGRGSEASDRHDAYRFLQGWRDESGAGLGVLPRSVHLG